MNIQKPRFTPGCCGQEGESEGELLRLRTWCNFTCEDMFDPGPNPLAAGGYYGKVYHCRFSQGNGTSFIVNFLPAHAVICGPAAASGPIPITYYNTNSQPSAIKHEGMDIQYTHCGYRGVGGRGEKSLMRLPQGGLRAKGKGRAKVVLCPRSGRDPQVDIPGPNSHDWRGFFHCRYGVLAWMRLATGQGRCPPLLGPDTEQ